LIEIFLLRPLSCPPKSCGIRCISVDVRKSSCSYTFILPITTIFDIATKTSCDLYGIKIRENVDTWTQNILAMKNRNGHKKDMEVE
jgi:hypothetical protein